MKFKTIVFLLSALMGGPVSFAQTDVGVTGLTLPTMPFCPGSQEVRVSMANFGTDTVWTANITWTMNGISQPGAFFNDTLAPGAATEVSLGMFLFNRKVSYTLLAATSTPNGLPDANPANDSYSLGGIISRMDGNYSAGIVSDYAGIQEAVDDLVLRGICGAVVININPGIFPGPLDIPEIDGASPVNTITFQSSTADSLSVVLTSPSSVTANDNYTLRLGGADYIIINQITIERTGSQPYAHVVELTQRATNNVLTHLRIVGATATVDSLAAGVFSGNLSSDPFNSISSCLFLGGAAGIFLQGKASSLPDTGLVVDGNRFSDQSASAISLTDQARVTVRGNSISTSVAGSDFTALRCSACVDKSRMEKNRVEGVPGKGIVMAGCIGDLSGRNTVANNFISVTDSAGLDLVGNAWLDVLFNSVHQFSPDTLHTAWRSLSTQELRVVNNIFLNSGGGPAILYEDSIQPGTIAKCNDVHSFGNTTALYKGMSLAQISDWQAFTGLDSGSVSVDPGFASPTDLHASAWQLAAGIPFGSIADDIDGELRSSSLPDMGADEFVAQVHDITALALVYPGDSSCVDDTVFLALLISNPGSFVETGFQVQAEITGDVTLALSQVYVGSLFPGDSDTVVFAQGIPLPSGGDLVIRAYVSSPFDVHPGNDTVIASLHLLPAPQVFLGNDTVITTPVPNHVLDAGPGFASYSWNTGDTTSSILALATGLYSVLVTDSSGCTASDSIQVTYVTGIASVSANELRILGDANTGRLLLEWRGSGSIEGWIVYDLHGREVASKQSVHSNAYVLNTSLLANGNYMLKVEAGGRLCYGRFIVAGR